jgi:uncharacterized membrane protein
MDCCNHNRSDRGNGKKHRNHIWMMALCCGLPILLLFLLPVLSSTLDLPYSVLRTAFTLLCPALMLLMCIMMMKDHKAAGDNGHDGNAECKQVKDGKM